MKNFLTFRQLDSALIHKAGLNENDIPPTLRQLYINDKLMKIYRLLDGLNDPWYHKQLLALSVGTDVEFLVDYNISSYSAGTHSIIRTSGVWKVGQVLSVVLYDTLGGVIASWVGIVSTVTAGILATLNIVAGTDQNKSTHQMVVTVLLSPTNNLIDLSNTYLKNIVRIYDNAYVGGKTRIFSPISDPAIFSVLHRDPFFDNRVAFFHRGDSVELYVGPTATALGTVNMEYRGKPTPCSDFDTDVLIDIPPEDNQVIMDEVLAEYLTHVGKPIPEDVANRQVEFQKRYDAAMADVQKQQTMIRGVRNNQ